MLLLFYFTQFFALSTHCCITCTHIIIENTHLKKIKSSQYTQKKNHATFLEHIHTMQKF
jgi:hypothetical protein